MNKLGTKSLLLCLLFSGTALATDPTEKLSELHHTQWLAREGGPSQINDIAQTPDGFLWLATTTGLLRFDGVRFEPFVAPERSRPIIGDANCLLTTANGDLWIGMRFGAAFLLHDGQVTEFGQSAGLPMHTIFRFAQRADGTIWAQTASGLFLFEHNRWSQVEKAWGYPGTGGYALFADKAGTLWAGGPGGYFSLNPDEHSFHKVRDPSPDDWGDILQGPGGVPWLSDDNGLSALSGPPRTIDGGALGAKSPSGVKLHATWQLLYDRGGTLWTLVNDGPVNNLIRIAGVVEKLDGNLPLEAHDIERLSSLESLSSTDAYNSKLFEDREGNVWVTTLGGLDRFRSNKLHALSAAVFPLEMAAVAATPDGDIWIRNPGNALLIHPHEAPVPLPGMIQKIDLESSVASLFAESEHNVWLGYERVGSASLVHYQMNTPTTITLPNASPAKVVQAMATDSAGALWISHTRDGVYRRDGDAWLLNGGLAKLPHEPALAMATDLQGGLWLSFTDNRLALVSSGRVRLFATTDGLDVGNAMVIKPAQNQVWVGGSANVAQYDNGRFWTLTKADGSAIAGAVGLVQDQEGALWINDAHGITHIPAVEIGIFERDHHYRVISEEMTYEDGLVGTASQMRPTPTAAQGGDGRIWFTTQAGVFWIDPKNIARNALPPSVIIQSVSANAQTYSWSRDATLPTLTTAFSIDYTATSLVMPNRVRFKYRLDGIDKDWQDAGTRRQAFYTNVPPGTRTFRVLAANEDGLWSPAAATATLRIPAAFYQTTWFQFLCGVMVLAVAYQLYRLRLRQIAKQMQMTLSARTDERERIARELHDTLLQGAQGMILLFQSIAGRLLATDPTRGEMERGLDYADRLLKDARDRVRELRAGDVSNNASDYIASLGTEITEGSSAEFNALTLGTRRTLTPTIAGEVYRIVREALTNAVRHAEASHIEAQIVYEADRLVLRIRDDGIGVDPEILRTGSRPGHYGIPGMRERAKNIGATFNVTRCKQGGTDVEITLPAALAYSAS